MDKRNLKKTELQDRKQEKKDGGDIKRMDKLVKKMVEPDSVDSKVTADLKKTQKMTRKTVDLNNSVGKILADREHFKKGDKQAKKTVDVDTNDGKTQPDRGDLQKAENQTKKVVEKHADRGDLKKADKITRKPKDLDANDPKVHIDSENIDPKRFKVDKPKLAVTIKKWEGKTKDFDQPNSKEHINNEDKITRKLKDLDANDPKVHLDSENSDPKTFKVDKPKLAVTIKKWEGKTKDFDQPNSKEHINKLVIDTSKTYPDDRRKVRDKTDLKVKNPPVTNVNREKSKVGNCKAEMKNDRPPVKTNDVKDKADESNECKHSLSITNTKVDKKDFQRKPIIRTISAKNDTTKFFKAVTFVDQKRHKPTLQIKLPNESRNPKNNTTETMTPKKLQATVSGGSVKEKVSKKSLRRDGRNDSSPSLSDKMGSPPTEVAKWAPSSINKHTKPYYEAWVNTTLAAISKNSKKDKLFLEKQNILQSFQRALFERPTTPELVHENYTDERYTGRIKIKQR